MINRYRNHTATFFLIDWAWILSVTYLLVLNKLTKLIVRLANQKIILVLVQLIKENIFIHKLINKRISVCGAISKVKLITSIVCITTATKLQRNCNT